MEPNDIPAEVPVIALPGHALREARERLGLSVSDVANQTKLAPRQIEALEADDFQRLPEMAFVRGFLRSYAKILQLDVQPLLDALPQAKGMSGHVAPASVEVPFPSAHSPQQQNLIWLGAALLLSVVVVAFAVWHFTSPQPVKSEATQVETAVSLPEQMQIVASSPVPVAVTMAASSVAVLPPAKPAAVAVLPPTVQSAIPQPVTVAPVVQAVKPVAKLAQSAVAVAQPVKPAVAAIPAVQPVAQAIKPIVPSPVPSALPSAKPLVSATSPAKVAPLVVPSSAQPIKPVIAPTAQPVKPVTPSVPPVTAVKPSTQAVPLQLLPAKQLAEANAAPQTVALRIVFEDESWTEVKDKFGKTLSSQVNTRGSELRLDGRPPFSLVVGHAEKVKVYHRGKQVDLTDYINDTSEVARITLE